MKLYCCCCDYNNIIIFDCRFDELFVRRVKILKLCNTATFAFSLRMRRSIGRLKSEQLPRIMDGTNDAVLQAVGKATHA